MIEQFASRTELEDEMQVLLGPERLNERDNERIGQLMQDFPLKICLLELALTQ